MTAAVDTNCTQSMADVLMIPIQQISNEDEEVDMSIKTWRLPAGTVKGTQIF